MLEAIVLGIVEGVTEFLPVSSTGHLILTGNLLGFTGDKAATFQIFIQLGAILAVVWLYRLRFGQLLDARSEGLSGQRGISLLAFTTLPALVLGFLLHGFIKENLFTPFTVVLGLAVGGVVIILIERRSNTGSGVDVDTMTVGQALRVGLFQTLALWPGVSRSAATIIGGMLSGMSRKAAVEYSFLAAVSQ